MGKKKGAILILVILLIASIIPIFSSCGIAQDEYDSVVAERDNLQSEMDEIKAVYPPREFNSLTELEDWIRNNKQPFHEYIDETFRSAIKVQEQGIEDGYLINILYDEDDTDPSSGWVFNGTLVNGRFYVWDPEEGIIYNWYSNILVK